ncbi:MAG TPA: hypothetical protein VG963_18715 [Polyangiaceae bacterium]|nr:hypothetical protein [Polyangiaceae bacterium]
MVANKATEMLVYSVDDIRRVLGCGRPAAYKLVKQLGKRIGRRFIVSKLVFEAWLASYETGAPRRPNSRRPRKAA